MRLNRKGFILEGVAVVWVAVSLIIGAVAIFKGPDIVKSVGGIIHGAAQKKAVSSRVLERTYYVPDEQHPGKFVKDHTDKLNESTTNIDSTEPPETLWQKFWHLGFMAVAIIAVLAYIGAWPLITLWWKKKVKPMIDAKTTELESLQTKHDELSWDAQLIVKSVDEGISAMDKAIAAAKSTADTAQVTLNQASLIVDAAQRAAAIAVAQNNLAIAQAVWSALDNMKTNIMTSISRKQDATTKAFVTAVQNGLSNV